ncbi:MULTISPECIES: hypothetical protein [Paenibacillus]|uniref:hypothetical protein n=1 Tax=Paenibacillus TaxID=44249 RepID=UPI0015764307|nr:hypothetical protein [Paenibacillus sp. JMULE4]NTZ19910.1 hypothetical protein [Paenibacillus sp. JMULE4]
MTDWNDEYVRELEDSQNCEWAEDYEEWQQHMRELAAELEELCDLAGRSADSKVRLFEARVEFAQTKLLADELTKTYRVYPELLRGPARKEYLAKLRQCDKAVCRLFEADSAKREAHREVIEAVMDLNDWWRQDQERMRERTQRLRELKKVRREG